MGSVETCTSGALRTVLRVQRLRCRKSWVWRKGWKQRWPSWPIVDESMLNKPEAFRIWPGPCCKCLGLIGDAENMQLPGASRSFVGTSHFWVDARNDSASCRLCNGWAERKELCSGTIPPWPRHWPPGRHTVWKQSPKHAAVPRFPDGSRTVPTMLVLNFHGSPTQERSAVDQAKCL